MSRLTKRATHGRSDTTHDDEVDVSVCEQNQGLTGPELHSGATLRLRHVVPKDADVFEEFLEMAKALVRSHPQPAQELAPVDATLLQALENGVRRTRRWWLDSAILPRPGPSSRGAPHGEGADTPLVSESHRQRHFVDPSLAVAALRGDPEKLLADVVPGSAHDGADDMRMMP